MVLLDFPVLVHAWSEVFPVLRRYVQCGWVVLWVAWLSFILVSDMVCL
jgi:hypothetical protein